MKKFLALISCVLLFSSPSISQDIRHYRSILDTTQNVSLKLIALDSIIAKSRLIDTETFIALSEQYIKIALESNHIENAAKKAMNLQYVLTDKKNNPSKAIAIIDQVLAHKTNLKDSFLLGGLHLKRGGANYRINFEEAIIDYTNALKSFREKDSIYVADAYLFRGQAYSSIGKFFLAGENYNIAYNYFKSLKDYEYMQYSLQGNITMYSMNGFFDKAKKERDKLCFILEDLGLKEQLLMPYFNQALDFKKQDKKKDEFIYLKKADSLLKQINDFNNYEYVIVHSGLANYYSDNYELEKAKYEILLLDSKKDKIIGDLLAETYYYSSKVNYNNKIKNYQIALKFALKKLKIAKELNHKEDLMNAHLLLSEVYYNLNDYSKSLTNKNIYHSIKDSIFNQNSANTLAYFQTLYETEKKERELIEQNADIQLLEKDNKSFKQLSSSIIIALVLLFGIIILYKNQRELKQIKNLHENFSQKLLQSQEDERVRISKDLHDDLGQKLLVIKNQLVTSGNQKTLRLVESTINEVRSISRDLYPFQLQELGITKAIESTLTMVDENCELFITSEIDNIDDVFEKNEEVNIFRIIQESMSNIVKHAKAQASRISISKLEDRIIVSIEDNGVGYDFYEKYNQTNSLGLKTMLERTKFLKGQMKVQSKVGNGTLIKYTFPIA